MQQTYITGHSYMARRLGAAKTYITGLSYMARRLGAANLHHGAQLHGKKVRCSKPTSWGTATWQEG